MLSASMVTYCTSLQCNVWEHDKALRHMKAVAWAQVHLQAVTFFGKVFWSEGISPDPDKVAALTKGNQVLHSQPQALFFTEATTDFMEGLTQDTALLRELLKVDAKFTWTPEWQRSFEQLQEMLIDDRVMTYFDPQLFKTRLKTDAGPSGMAATMMQYDPEAKQWQPVTYHSRAFTDTKTRHSQLEKEAKAAERGIFSIQIYLYGMRNTFEVDTNHKPLVPLLSGYRTTAPLHL